MNVEPEPGVLATRSVPACASTSSRATYRPSPSPPRRRSGAARSKRWKMRASAPGSMPSPWSSTVRTTSSDDASHVERDGFAGAVLHGIRQQVRDNLRRAHPIPAADDRSRGGQGELASRTHGIATELLDDLFHHRRKVEVAGVKAQMTAREARDVEQSFGETREAFGLAKRSIEAALNVGSDFGSGERALERLELELEWGERRRQLVRGDGEEFVASFDGTLGLETGGVLASEKLAALRGDRAEREERRRNHRQIELKSDDRVAQIAESNERPVSRHRAPERQHSAGECRRRCSPRPEAKGGPHQNRKQEVRATEPLESSREPRTEQEEACGETPPPPGRGPPLHARAPLSCGARPT